MAIDLLTSTEQRLRDLAARQGREVPVLVEEAIQNYLVASTLTDLDEGDLGAAQVTLMQTLQARGSYLTS